jgi:protein-tyrosine phosphatase
MAPLHPPIFAVRDVPAVADGWLVLADDSQHTGQLPTVVRIAGKQNRIEREGAVTASALEEKSPCRILFVCTGNTCRSPMAEALCRRLLADRLGCEPAQLPRHGFAVESAGLAALAGDEPSPEAIQAVRHYGADLSEHRSRPLTPDLLADADFVLAMTRTHLQFLVGWDVGVGPRRPRLLSSRGEDIDDPIGGTLEVYHACARQIVDHLQELLAELLEAQ